MTDKQLYEMEALLEDMTKNHILSKIPFVLQDENNPEKHYKFWWTESIVWYNWLKEIAWENGENNVALIELCMRLASKWYIDLETFL